MWCCACPQFHCCRPRYKRLVDSIYPRAPPMDQIVNENLQKLTYYSIIHAEKLNRIGIYLADRLSLDLYWQRRAELKVSVDAMDALLKSCHGSPSLAQFIDSYLRIAKCLLITNDPSLEKLGTDLFVRFSSIQEETLSSSIHRQDLYDFFVTKFSEMCHHTGTGTPATTVRSARRHNGLLGLRGIIWKSTKKANVLTLDHSSFIWAKSKMARIVPSILANLSEELMKDPLAHDESGTEQNRSELNSSARRQSSGDELLPGYGSDDYDLEDDPHPLALQCLRELFQKCNSNSLKLVLRPVFKHFDDKKRWDLPSEFATRTLKTILFSVQSQHSYFIAQELMGHLERTPPLDFDARIGIANVLFNIVCIVGAVVGPTVLSLFNSFLKQMRLSIEFERSGHCTDEETERLFQSKITEAIYDFFGVVPDYQKLEIMGFLANAIPISASRGSISMNALEQKGDESSENDSESVLRRVLVKLLRQLSTNYQNSQYQLNINSNYQYQLVSVFTDSFLQKILKLMLVENDVVVRLDAQFIFHSLIDRHKNLDAIVTLVLPRFGSVNTDHTSVEEKTKSFSRALNLDVIASATTCRHDYLFMKRNLEKITPVLCRCVLIAFETAGNLPSVDSNDSKTSDELLNAFQTVDAVFCSMVLLMIEVGMTDTTLFVVVELLQLAIALQQLAVDFVEQEQSLSPMEGRGQQVRKFASAVHLLVAKYMWLNSEILTISEFTDYVRQVLISRSGSSSSQDANTSSSSDSSHDLLPPSLLQTPRDVNLQHQTEDNKHSSNEMLTSLSNLHTKAPLVRLESMIEPITDSETTTTGNNSARSIENKDTPFLNRSNSNQSIGIERDISDENEPTTPTFMLFEPGRIADALHSLLMVTHSSSVASSPSTTSAIFGSSAMGLSTMPTSLGTLDIINRLRQPSRLLQQTKSPRRFTFRQIGRAPSRKQSAAEMRRQMKSSSGFSSVSTSSSEEDPTVKPKNDIKRPTTIFILNDDEGNATAIERPVTLDDLRRLAHAPIDPLEEGCLDRERARHVLERFRGKNMAELSELFAPQQQLDREDGQDQDHQRQASFPRKNLVDRMKEIMKEHEEFIQHQEPNGIESIFDLQLPPMFRCKNLDCFCRRPNDLLVKCNGIDEEINARNAGNHLF